jgi:hypothetical protein
VTTAAYSSSQHSDVHQMMEYKRQRLPVNVVEVPEYILLSSCIGKMVVFHEKKFSLPYLNESCSVAT